MWPSHCSAGLTGHNETVLGLAMDMGGYPLTPRFARTSFFWDTDCLGFFLQYGTIYPMNWQATRSFTRSW